MSGWDAYLAFANSKNGSATCTACAIYGLDGAKWAEKGDIKVAAANVKSFVAFIKGGGKGDPPALQVSAALKLMYLGYNLDCITGKKAEIGGAICMSNKACIIALCKGPPQDALKAAEAVKAQLKSKTF